MLKGCKVQKVKRDVYLDMSDLKKEIEKLKKRVFILESLNTLAVSPITPVIKRLPDDKNTMVDDFNKICQINSFENLDEEISKI